MKKISKYFVVGLFIFAFLVPLAFSHAYTFTQPLVPFKSSGEDVSQLQFILSKEGFFKGNVSGNYGALTVEAVRKYQAKHGLVTDGSVGPKTLAVLNGQVLGVATSTTSTDDDKEGVTSCDTTTSVSQYVSFGMVHKDVAIVQERLDCFGFTDGPNDGIYGKQTMESVAAFQKSRGINGDGSIVGKETLAALNITLVSRTTVLPEFTVKRSFGTPGPTTVAPGTTNIHFADYELSTNSYTSGGTITLTSFTVILRQRTPSSPAVVKNLKLFICPVSTAVCTTQVGATIPNPHVTNGPFSLNTFNVNVPFSVFEVKKATLRFDVDSSAVDGTMIDTEPGSGIFASVTPTNTTVVHTPPLEASVVTVRRPNNLISLSLTKDVGYENGGSASPTSFQLILSGPTPVTGTTPVFANVQPGVYLLTENGPTGYTMSWTCSGGTVNGNQLTIPSNSTGVNCNIYNDDIPPRITLNKIVAPGAPDPESAWTISATKISGGQPGVGYSMTGPGAVGNTDVVSNDLAQAGRYRLVESGPTANYTNSGWSCNGVQTTQTGPYTAEFTIDINQSTTCTITNTYSQPPQPPTLSLRKVIANGGPAQITNWNLIANPVTSGQPTVQGLGGFGVTTVSPGVFALSEVGSGPNVVNYTQGTWTCTDGTLSGSNLTLSNGDNAVCTITNTYVPPPATITLKKTIANGGPITNVSGFPVRLDGNPYTWSQAVTVTPGVHTFAETPQPNYTPSPWTGTGCTNTGLGTGSVNISAGQNITCTITNTYNPPSTLTLIKIVSGGPSAGNNTPFTPLINGSSVGVQWGVPKPVTPNTLISISESWTIPNYTPGQWTGSGCNNSNLGGSGFVTVAPGENKVCTITNTYVPPTTLSLVKILAGNGPAQITNWNLIADPTTFGQPTLQGLGGFPVATVQPGTFILSEVGSGPNVANYTQGTWTCTDGTLSGNTTTPTLTLSQGDTAVCRITNTYIPPATITLNKTVSNVGPFPNISDYIPYIDNVPVTWGVPKVVTAPGTHNIHESSRFNYLPSGWTGANCTSISTGPATAVVNIVPGQNVVCNITNTYVGPGTIILNKVVVGGPSAGNSTPFTPSIDGSTTTWGTPISVTPNQAHIISESWNIPNYTKGQWVGNGCSNPTTGIFAGMGIVTVAPGETKTCTITNTYNPPAPTLKLVKIINGITPTPNTNIFTPRINGDVKVWGQVYTMTPGTHFVSESTLPNYNAGTWGGDCAPFTPSSGLVVGVTTLAPGDNKVCTITNTYVPPALPKLTLVKSVRYVKVPTTPPSAWTLKAQSPTTIISGQTGTTSVTNVSVNPGTYTLSESGGTPGFSASLYSCVKNGGTPVNGNSITLANGDNAICTITNTEMSACSVNLTATPLVIPRNSSSTLTWTSNCQNTYLNGARVAQNNSTGQSTGPLTANRTYTLTGSNISSCTTGSCLSSSQVTVRVHTSSCVIDSFTAPTSRSVNGLTVSATASWQTTGCTNATLQSHYGRQTFGSLVVDGVETTNVAVDGSRTVTRTFTYPSEITDTSMDLVLIASNSTDITSQTKTINITNVPNPQAQQCPINNLVAVPMYAVANNPVTVTWNPTGCGQGRVWAWTPSSLGTHGYTDFGNQGNGFTRAIQKSTAFVITSQTGYVRSAKSINVKVAQ